MTGLRFAALCVLMAVAGCQLVTDFDRSLIPDTSASDAGTDDAATEDAGTEDAGQEDAAAD